jgi:predicted ester cyclase
MTTSTTELPVPGTITIDPALDGERTEAALETARRFYGFWDTGDAAQLQAAIAPSFEDHTLPAGRPQGPDGPHFASRQFRAAVPDLRCEVEELVVAGEKLTARLRFHGTFTGAFGDRAGAGQRVDFIAIDVLGLRDGKITDNWHLEDNLTLMQQLGVVAG